MITLIDKVDMVLALLGLTHSYKEALKKEFVIQVDECYIRTPLSAREQITGEPYLGWKGWLVKGNFLGEQNFRL